MSLLEIDRLSLGIHELPILKDVSFAIAAGEVFGVIGESGSGKSLTAYSVMRLLPRGAAPTGAVRLDGEDLLAKSEREMCRVRGPGSAWCFRSR